jgi:serine protease Do
VKDGDDLVAQISEYKPGTNVDLGYLRSGQSLHATVTIDDREKVLAAMNNAANSDNEQGPGQAPGNVSPAKLGITVTDLPQGAPAGLHGVLIQSVKPGSFADEIGVGDFQGGVIVSINKHPINNIQDFQTAVTALHGGDDVVLEIVNPQNPTQGNEYLGGTLP